MNQAQTPTTAPGLDALNDDALMSELAARGLDTLLERAFEVNNVPPAERQVRRGTLLLSRLGDGGAKLTAAQRQQLVGEIVRNLDAALPAIDDPQLLLRQASVLITQGVEPLVNTLEYWGENTRTQAALQPIAQAVMKILDRCHERATAAAERVANQITASDSPHIARYNQLEQLAATANYTRQMAAYYVALSLDSANPQRTQIAAAAIAQLQPLDVPANPDRWLVRNRMAKLAMTAGELDRARELFAAVIVDSADPKPTVAQQYEARYFTSVVELLAKNPAAARGGLDELQAWQEKNLPQDKTALDGASAAAAMLEYRILCLESELAKDPQQKHAADERAVAVLSDLLSRRPELRVVIYEQLASRLDERSDLRQVPPLLLRAVIARGEVELHKPPGEAIDKHALERAAGATEQVLRRRGEDGIDAQMRDASALLAPFFLDKLDRKPAAANAFVDYAEQFKQTNPKNATLALDNAQALIGQLRTDAESRQDPAVTRAYERFLPLAIVEPFGRREFAFEYARRLQLNGEAALAARYFQLVPQNDKRLLEARFGELLTMRQQLDDSPPGSADRANILEQIQHLADQVQQIAVVEPDRNRARAIVVRTTLLAADVARREQNNPRRALQLLQGFSQHVAGLPNAQSLLNEAMYIRVQSHMAAGENSAATEQLVRLLSKTEGAHGAQIVYNLLEKLNADFDRAQQAGDRAAMKLLAKNRAQLSGFLAEWAASNADENIRRFTYRYKVFDADTQRRAADLEDDDPAAHAAGMQVALARYQALQSPENLALYKASLDAHAATVEYDPQVTLGIALVQYELGQYEVAAQGLNTLLAQRKLGTAVLSVEENGQEKTVDNDPYWEAVLKLIRCNMKLNRDIEQARQYLKLQYITWGNRVGGKKWKGDFESLRRELIPQFVLEPQMNTDEHGLGTQD